MENHESRHQTPWLVFQRHGRLGRLVTCSLMSYTVLVYRRTSDAIPEPEPEHLVVSRKREPSIAAQTVMQVEPSECFTAPLWFHIAYMGHCTNTEEPLCHLVTNSCCSRCSTLKLCAETEHKLAINECDVAATCRAWGSGCWTGGLAGGCP